jgi:hypothetical protein
VIRWSSSGVQDDFVLDPFGQSDGQIGGGVVLGWCSSVMILSSVMHFNRLHAREGGASQLVALLSSVLLEGFVDFARCRPHMSSSWSMSRRLTEKAGGGSCSNQTLGGEQSEAS